MVHNGRIFRDIVTIVGCLRETGLFQRLYTFCDSIGAPTKRFEASNSILGTF